MARMPEELRLVRIAVLSDLGAKALSSESIAIARFYTELVERGYRIVREDGTDEGLTPQM